MPLVRIDIPQGWPEARIAAFADAVHDSLVETVDVPHNDRFQVIAEHARSFLGGYLGHQGNIVEDGRNIVEQGKQAGSGHVEIRS